MWLNIVMKLLLLVLTFTGCKNSCNIMPVILLMIYLDQNGLPFWCRQAYQVVQEKRPLNGCVEVLSPIKATDYVQHKVKVHTTSISA